MTLAITLGIRTGTPVGSRRVCLPNTSTSEMADPLDGTWNWWHRGLSREDWMLGWVSRSAVAGSRTEPVHLALLLVRTVVARRHGAARA